jgi:hypothetical protein
MAAVRRVKEGRASVDVHGILDDLAKMIESARALPMSASCVINRREALILVDRLRETLPQELRHAELLLREREALIEESRRDGEHLIAAAHEERNRILSAAPPDPFAAQHEDLYAESAAIKQEADDYVDQQLANLEVILNKALASVQRGRDRLRPPGGYPDASAWPRNAGLGGSGSLG